MGFTGNELATPEMFRHVYKGISKEELERKVNELLASWGYKLKGGESGQVIFEKGSRTKRILLGAMAKYFKISVCTTVTGPDELKCEVRSQSTGFSGGLIGINQMKTEIRNLFMAFQNL